MCRKGTAETNNIICVHQKEFLSISNAWTWMTTPRPLAATHKVTPASSSNHSLNAVRRGNGAASGRYTM